jgi:hypothetical protein
VLIEDATITFGDGLTALTGETGAGDALTGPSARSWRAGRGWDVGTAATKPRSAVFDLMPARQPSGGPRELAGLGGAAGHPHAPSGQDRKDRCYLNDSSVTLTSLAAVAEPCLVRRAARIPVARPAYQMAVLDHRAGPRRELAAARRAPTKEQKAERAGRQPAARNERLRDIELLRFQISSWRRNCRSKTKQASRPSSVFSRRGHPTQPWSGGGAAQTTGRLPTRPS